jgi:hypothetical protein
VITNTVDLGQIGSLDLMEKALREKYSGVSRRGGQFAFYTDGWLVTLTNGQAQSGMSRARLNQVVSDVKKAYSRATVYEAADQFGWLVEQDADNPDELVVYRN